MSAPKTIKTGFTDGLAEAFLKEEEPLPVMIRDRSGNLHALTGAVVTRIVGPDGEERRVMVLEEGPTGQEASSEELN